MKVIFSAIFILASVVINATTYYVAPNGNDNNPGSITQPWATWQKGFSSVTAGDILYIRGGTYTGMYGSGHGVNISNRDGNSSNVITVSAYPGEKPVLDCASLSSSAGVNFGILMRGCDYWNIKGLTVKNVREYRNLHKSAGGLPTAGWELGDCNNVTLELCIVTVCGNGFSLHGTLKNINYINCDAYLNYDYYDNGGLANGFNGHIESNSTIFYKGCRSWSNSDDGYDNYAGAGYITYNDCWAYRNGRDTPTSGNGDGFKLGYDNSGTELSGSQRTLYNCVSADNTLMGFDESMDGVTSMDMALYNCIAYKNTRDYGFRFSQSLGTGRTTLKNNISYGNNVNYSGRTRNISDHNSWNTGAPAVSDADFISLDMNQLTRARKQDGSLPDIEFSRLAATSDLIDAGVNIGLPFSGTSPDLGSFEIQKAASAPTTSIAYVSSVVKSTSPSDVEISYNLTLSTIQPAPSSFEVKVNTAVRTIQNLRLSGKNVYLTLASPILAGDMVTLSYFKPSANPLQCAGGSQAESISAKTVLNSVEAAVPVYVSAVVEDVTPSKVEMIYDINLAPIVPATSAFELKINGNSISVKAVSINGNKVNLTLSAELVKKDTITIAYTAPSINPLQTSLGGKAVTIGNQVVTNNILGISTKSEKLVNNGKIIIYPNPAIEYISIANFNPVIEAEEVPVLRIYDFAGKLCQEIHIEDSGMMKKIPVRLTSGFYLVRLMVGKMVHYTQKLIVVK